MNQAEPICPLGQLEVKRTWCKCRIKISNESELAIDIWDSGSHIYERWPDGDVCWKVISREITGDCFSEILQKMPEWFVPGEVLHWARVPLVFQGPSQFQLGQWSVVVESQTQPVFQATLQPQLRQQSQTQETLQPHSRQQSQKQATLQPHSRQQQQRQSQKQSQQQSYQQPHSRQQQQQLQQQKSQKQPHSRLHSQQQLQQQLQTQPHLMQQQQQQSSQHLQTQPHLRQHSQQQLQQQSALQRHVKLQPQSYEIVRSREDKMQGVQKEIGVERLQQEQQQHQRQQQQPKVQVISALKKRAQQQQINQLKSSLQESL